MSAASSAARARNSNRSLLENEEHMMRRKAVERKRELRRHHARLVFAKHSIDGESLSEKVVPKFLAESLSTTKKKIKKEQLEEHAVQLVIDTAYKLQKDDDLKAKKHIAKDALLDSVEKYAEYVSMSQKIDGMFEKFDINKDGVLSRAELRQALEDYEKNADHKVRGLTLRLEITEADLDFVLKASDADDNGSVSQNEVLPAIAAWEELCQTKIEEKEAESCCTIL